MDSFTTLEAVLLQLKKELAEGKKIDSWDKKSLYAEKSLCRQSRFNLSDQCIPAAGTTVSDDDIEHLPPEIEAMGLGLYCYGQDLVDVVSSAVEQRPKATAQELLQALNYHNINDSFIDFSEAKKRPKKWSIGIFPRFSAGQLKHELSKRDTDVLSRGHLLEYPSGSVVIESGDSEIISLCNLISFQSEWAKKNALFIIRNDLRRKVRSGVVGTGSMSDPYNPFEKDLLLTRHALELIDAFDFGAAIATKSTLLLRDLDILQTIKEHSPVLCKVTITTADDILSKKIEPGVPPSSDRFAMIDTLNQAGIFSGILLMPVLPWLEDSEENIRSLVRQAHEAGARFIYAAFGMTLRENQRNWYYAKLEQLFPPSLPVRRHSGV